MSEPFVGQIEIFGFNYAPRSWALCAGQLLSINQNQALFSLLGTNFGGNGTTTFGLPDLQGRVAAGQGATPFGQWTPGVKGGEEGHVLSVAETPLHTHSIQLSNSTTTSQNTEVPGPDFGPGVTTGTTSGGQSMDVFIYAADAKPASQLGASAISTVGGVAHENRMPVLALNVCICTQGIYPSRN